MSEGCNPGQTLEAQGVVLHDEIRSLVVRDALVTLVCKEILISGDFSKLLKTSKHSRA